MLASTSRQPTVAAVASRGAPDVNAGDLCGRSRRTGRCCRGFSLLEVLIAMLVLGVGLLGLASMQTRGLRDGMLANQRTQATFLAYDILDRMRANRTVANQGGYVIDLATDPVEVDCLGVAATCTPTMMASFDLLQWRTALANTLPEGRGAVVSENGGNAVVQRITVQWDESRGAGEAIRQFVVRSRL